MKYHVREDCERPPSSTSAFRSTRFTHQWAWSRLNQRSLPCPQRLTKDRQDWPLSLKQTPSLRHPQPRFQPPSPPGGWGLECVSLISQFSEPRQHLWEALAKKAPPRSSLILCPLWRSRSNGLRTAVPHHTPFLAAQPTPRARRQKKSAAPSAPISFRRLPAPPAPQPLDCGR